MPEQAGDSFVSPRITAVYDAMQTGNMAALTTFWEEIVTTGTPLIEPIADRDDVALVSFLWRGDTSTTHVVLYSEFLRGMWWNSWADALMFRLGDTTVFYRTYRIRTDMRFVYWIAPITHYITYTRYTIPKPIMLIGSLIHSIRVYSSRTSTAPMSKCPQHHHSPGFSHVLLFHPGL